MLNRHCCRLICAGVLAFLSGCVEQRFVIDSTPPGAKVYVNNRPVGFTPVDVPFTYYGTYLITLELDGYQTRHIEQEVAAPWYAYPPIDFAVENLNPWKVADVRRLSYDLTGLTRPNPDELRLQAEELRQRGRNVPEPTIPSPPNRPGEATPTNPRNRGNGGAAPPPIDPVP
jgi:hypothetical protein